MHLKRLIPVAFSLAVVGSWVFAGAASALDLGPVSVPITLPPPLVALVPPIGPVTVTTPPGTPQLGVSVSASPTAGVSVGATLPPSVGPIPLLPGAPHSVQVTLGPSGVAVTTSPSAGTTAAGAPASGDTPTVASSGSAAGSAGAEPSSSASAPHVRGPAPASIGPGQPLPAGAANDSDSGGPVASSPNAQAIPGAVSASLRRPAPGGTWGLLRSVTSAHTLWIAFAVALLAARWAMNGFVRDARRRGRPRKPSVPSTSS